MDSNAVRKLLMTAPKAFDVFPPGKTAATATSRPVIIGRQPKTHDSTLTDKPSDMASAPDENKILDSQDKITIEPVAAPESSSSVPEESTAEEFAPAEATSAQASHQSEPTAGPEPAAGSNELAPAESEIPAAESHSVINQTAVPLSPANETVPNEPEISVHQTQQTITNQPIISHHEIRRHWVKPFIIVVLVLMFCLIALDITLDAGILKTTAIPHTHFLK